MPKKQWPPVPGPPLLKGREGGAQTVVPQFLEIEVQKGPTRSCASRDCRATTHETLDGPRAFVSGILAPQRATNLRVGTKTVAGLRAADGRRLQLIEPPSQSDRAFNPLHRCSL
jgi:hypothetical protein